MVSLVLEIWEEKTMPQQDISSQGLTESQDIYTHKQMIIH